MRERGRRGIEEGEGERKARESGRERIDRKGEWGHVR